MLKSLRLGSKRKNLLVGVSGGLVLGSAPGRDCLRGWPPTAKAAGKSWMLPLPEGKGLRLSEKGVSQETGGSKINAACLAAWPWALMTPRSPARWQVLHPTCCVKSSTHLPPTIFPGEQKTICPHCQLTLICG